MPVEGMTAPESPAPVTAAPDTGVEAETPAEVSETADAIAPEAELVADDKGNVEEVEQPWTGEDWTGDLDSIPEKHRDVAKVIIDRFTATIEENEQIIQALERALDSTGEDPRLEQLQKQLEERNRELEAQRAAVAERDGTLEQLRSEYGTKASEWTSFIEQREAEDMARFVKENPKLADESSKEYARLQEILEDEGEEDLWGFWDLPALVDLKKAEYNKVKKLRKEGVPTQHALRFVQLEAAKKADTRMPDDVIAGAGGGPGSRPTAPKSIKDAPDLKSKIALVAENALLRSAK